MEFLYLLKALLRRKWIIVISVLIALAAAYLLTINEKKQYKSVAQIATGFTNSEELRIADQRFNLQEIDVKFNNTIENFTSAKVLSLLSYNLMLHDLTADKPFKQLTPDKKEHGVFKKFNREAAIPLLNTKLGQLQPLRQDIPEEKNLADYIRLYDYDVASINKNLQVSRVPKTDYVNIAYTSENPELSAYAANTLIKEFEHYFNLNKQQRSDTSIVALDSLAQQKKAELDRKTALRTQYLSSRGILDVKTEGSNKMQQVADYQNQLTQERGNRQRLLYQINEYTNLINSAKTKNTTSTTSGNSDNLTYVSLRNQYTALMNEYSQKGYNDPEIAKKLEDLKSRMQQLAPSRNGTVPADNTAANIADLTQRKIDAQGQLRESEAKIAIYQNT
ncbi:MAG TPA: Wzz/FepE/Etk N-terminal domain-containing protein, partial [Niastella sp.]|nr:Wzz/FepE/Etk N-terminal domain-containing protein [Niastella sp.]